MTEMQYCDSSNIEMIGYDAEAMELHVQFLENPSPYIYMMVPEHVFEELMQAPSKGSYLNREIKGTYEFRR